MSPMDSYLKRVNTAIELTRRKIGHEFQKAIGEAGYGLTAPQYFMMRYIRDHEPCMITKVAEKMDVKPSAITVMIDRLVQGDFVSREHGQDDRRVVLVRLTEQGQAVIRQMDEVRKKMTERYLSNLDEQELEQFVNILEKLANRFEQS